VLPNNLKDIFSKEKEEEKEEGFKKVKDDLHKKIIFNILVIESLIKKDKKLKAFVDKLRKAYPILDE
jgi:hypothetical protein